jgi:nucleoside phosphorylase
MAPTEDDVRVYFLSELPTRFPDGSTGIYRLIVTPLLGMGRVQAAVATGDAIRRWHPRFILLVGIAGGVSARNVRLGDVLVADQIVDYELQKNAPEGLQVHWDVHQADPRLLGSVRNLSDTDWRQLVAEKRPGEGLPTRHVGPIASGDKVVACGEVLARLRDHWPSLIGVEMEAAGLASAAFQAAGRPGFLMVRGVSDLADEEKGAPHIEKWRAYACDVAASCAITLLKSGPVPVQSNLQPGHVSFGVDDHDIPLPRVKKRFSQLEKDRYLGEAFELVKQAFREALSEMERRYEDVETDFSEIHNLKFVAKIYVQGDLQNQCKIWVGGLLSPDTIYYSEGRIDINQDNAWNDSITVEDDGFEMCLRLSNMWLGHPLETRDVDGAGGAGYLWRRFSSSLER